MSRSGYTDDCENLGLWRASVSRAIHGKRGQALLREMLAALDAMPTKELIAGTLRDARGHVCALGSVCATRGLDPALIDYEEADAVGRAFGIAGAMAAEIAYINDEAGPYRGETDAERFVRVRAWVERKLTLKEAP